MELYNLEKIHIRAMRDFMDGGHVTEWQVWIPYEGPLVNHIPLAKRFEWGDAESGLVLGPFGESYWPTGREAFEFVRRVMREYEREKEGATE